MFETITAWAVGEGAILMDHPVLSQVLALIVKLKSSQGINDRMAHFALRGNLFRLFQKSFEMRSGDLWIIYILGSDNINS